MILGWSYGTSFVHLETSVTDESSHASRHPTDVVKRRRWIRYYQKKTVAVVQGDTLGNRNGLETVLENEQDDKVKEEQHIAPPPSSSPLKEEALFVSKEKKGFGFKVPKITSLKVPKRLRGEKDITKEYQNLGTVEMEWLLSVHPKDPKKSAQALAMEAASLEERIATVSSSSIAALSTLSKKQDVHVLKTSVYTSSLQTAIEDYKRLRKKNDALESSMETIVKNVVKLRKETNALDALQNEEQRVLNTEMEASNVMLEEKAKALATARKRYKSDIARLSSNTEKASGLQKREEPDERLALRTLYAQIVEAQNTLKGHSTPKKTKTKSHHRREGRSLQIIDTEIAALKEEQKRLIKAFANTDVTNRAKMNVRREEIRNQLSALREERSQSSEKIDKNGKN